VRHLFRLSVLFVLGQMLYRAVTQRCGSEASIFGWKLRRHVYHTMMAELGHKCVSACQKDDRCQSFNFVISVGMCEFSDRTKEARPEDFIFDPDRYYFRRAMNRGNQAPDQAFFFYSWDRERRIPLPHVNSESVKSMTTKLREPKVRFKLSPQVAT